MQSIVSPPNSLPSMHDRKTASFGVANSSHFPWRQAAQVPLLQLQLKRFALCTLSISPFPRRNVQNCTGLVANSYFRIFSTFQLVAHLSASFYMQVHRRITTTWLLKLFDNISEAPPTANSTRPPCFVDLVFSIVTPVSARTGLMSPFLQLILTLSLKSQPPVLTLTIRKAVQALLSVPRPLLETSAAGGRAGPRNRILHYRASTFPAPLVLVSDPEVHRASRLLHFFCLSTYDFNMLHSVVRPYSDVALCSGS